MNGFEAIQSFVGRRMMLLAGPKKSLEKSFTRLGKWVDLIGRYVPEAKRVLEIVPIVLREYPH